MQRLVSRSFRQLYSRHCIQRKPASFCQFSTKNTKNTEEDDKATAMVELLVKMLPFGKKCAEVILRHPLDKETLLKLERLSGLQFKDQKEIDGLREEIRLADKIFEVDTEGVEPLYSIVEELIDCPLREDEPVKPDQSKIFANATEHVEGFFVSPPANVVVNESEALKQMK